MRRRRAPAAPPVEQVPRPALRCRQSFTMRRMGMCRRGRRSRRNIAARRRIGLSICFSAAARRQEGLGAFEALAPFFHRREAKSTWARFLARNG
jgi:hypothetical protein